jgi:tetratricopeptide (TPR) repeat protein
MAAKDRSSRSPRLSPAQQESPETLSSEELARRRAQIERDVRMARDLAAPRLLNEGARLLRTQRPAEALAPLQQAYELAPDDPDVAVTLGGALVMTAQWSAAVRFLEAAVEQHPENARLLLNLAAAHLGRLEFSSFAAQERAIGVYKSAIEVDPVAENAHYSIGLIYAERQDWPEAEIWFQAALRAYPSDADAGLWLRRTRAAQMTPPPENPDSEAQGEE